MAADFPCHILLWIYKDCIGVIIRMVKIKHDVQPTPVNPKPASDYKIPLPG